MFKNFKIKLNENHASAFCYLFFIISGIVVFLLEKKNRKIKFHAIQSIIFSSLIIIVALILNYIPIIGKALFYLVQFPIVVIWIFLIFTAYKGYLYKLPILGNISYKLLCTKIK